jgi:hypothetical protein
MVYPVFEKSSIANRFREDMLQFKKLYLMDNDDVDEDTFLKSYEIMLDDCDSLIKLKTRLKLVTDRISEIAEESITDFNYPHDILKYDVETQKKLWCLRTLLFYQLLITVTEMMRNKTLFDEVYDYSSKNSVTPSRTFIEDVTKELENYKMGIFGSITPSSDIDIGIQYSGIEDVIGLAYVVSVFEDSFLIFTGINSLSYDIETYADLMTLPEKSMSGGDVFYLDTSHLTEENLSQLLPYVEASILRNYVTAQLDLGSQESVERILSTFNYTDMFRETDIPQNIRQKFLSSVPLTELTEEAKDLIISYMSASYAEAREKYYDLVKIAEKSIEQVRQQYFKTGEVKLSNEEIVTIMINISKALVYRAESYTSPPTVMHVVRVLQSNSKNPEKYKSLEPTYCVTNKLTDAYCNIGPYGYIISLLEQIGYMYRFFLTYCVKESNDHYNEGKCKKKLEKYTSRFDNAVSLIKAEPLLSQGGTRRRRRTRRKSTRKRRKSQKKRRRTKKR